jgi:hypothetical protein
MSGGIGNEESLGQLASLLASGLDSLSRNQTVSFQQYTKVVLSQDGYVFWVATGAPFNAVGSLHFSTDRVQEEDQTIGVNLLVFTSEQEITPFNAQNPQTLFIGTWALDGNPVQIAFSRRGAYYRQSNLWHYSGMAVYPAMTSQVVNSGADIPAGPIVSNSLPIWLTLTTVGTETVPVYPSFLVPDNVTPPYIVAHIEPNLTTAIQPFPLFQWPGTPTPATNTQNQTSQQLMQDHVRLTLYGLTNQQAIQYLSFLMDTSLNLDNFGFVSLPAIRDDKREQVEIAALAMKKTIEMDVSYYQSAADTQARRLILEALITVTVGTL